MTKKQSAPPKPLPIAANFVIGGLSGMMATSIVQPMDLMKTRMQLLCAVKQKSMTTFAVGRDIYKKEGLIGFYSGLSAGLLRQATYCTTRIGIFQLLFDAWTEKYGGPPRLSVKIMMGITAGACGAVVGTPSEVILVRMTSDGRLPPEKRRNYKHVFNAVNRIIKEEGILTLWRGVLVTVKNAMVLNGAQLSSYTQTREILLPIIGYDGFFLHVCSSLIAGFVTSFCSIPFDKIKTRIQQDPKTTSIWPVLKHIIQVEGVTALWTGFLPYWSKVGPHTVFTFVFLEQWVKLYRKMYQHY